MLNWAAYSGVRAWGATPRKPRRTCPVLTIRLAASPHEIDSNREADAGEADGVTENRRVDAGYPSRAIHQRAVPPNALTLPRPHRKSDPKGIADREHYIPGLQLVAMTKRGGSEIVRVDLQDGDVGQSMGADWRHHFYNAAGAAPSSDARRSHRLHAMAALLRAP